MAAAQPPTLDTAVGCSTAATRLLDAANIQLHPAHSMWGNAAARHPLQLRSLWSIVLWCARDDVHICCQCQRLAVRRHAHIAWWWQQGRCWSWEPGCGGLHARVKAEQKLGVCVLTAGKRGALPQRGACVRPHVCGLKEDTQAEVRPQASSALNVLCTHVFARVLAMCSKLACYQTQCWCSARTGDY